MKDWEQMSALELRAALLGMGFLQASVSTDASHLHISVYVPVVCSWEKADGDTQTEAVNKLLAKVIPEASEKLADRIDDVAKLNALLTAINKA